MTQRRRWLSWPSLLILGLLMGLGVWLVPKSFPASWQTALGLSDQGAEPTTLAAIGPVDRREAEAFCGACHPYPEPDLFPKDHWTTEVFRGFDFFDKSNLDLEVPNFVGVLRHYQDHAPEHLPTLEPATVSESLPVSFERRGIPGPNPGELPAISHVGLVTLDDSGPVWLACDMIRGQILTCRLDTGTPEWTILAEDLGHPARAEVVDLNGNGRRDLIVADLGASRPTDNRWGRVLWLQQQDDGTFSTHVLAKGLGRVADVQAADFDGDGNLDLIVAVFGWQNVGDIRYLKNQGLQNDVPTFEHTIVDSRTGAIHVPVADLNGDGLLDFVALISQEHETVVAFLNQGDGTFEPQTLFEGPHPAFGSSGIQVVDLDGDGDLDVLLTNGDVYDAPLLKPYHGVSWLENQGEFPFKHHDLAQLYGAHRALAADLDGDGDLDIIATSFLLEPVYNVDRQELEAAAILFLEQTEPGQFQTHVLETISCDYPSFALGDVNGNGRIDLVLGSFRLLDPDQPHLPLDPSEPIETLWLWENQGPAPLEPPLAAE